MIFKTKCRDIITICDFLFQPRNFVQVDISYPRRVSDLNSIILRTSESLVITRNDVDRFKVWGELDGFVEKLVSRFFVAKVFEPTYGNKGNHTQDPDGPKNGY
jgi:hypothetical protein